jgi:hypothetical protein
MPVHDWTRVPAGVFHDFHQTWITEIKRALNEGLLPPDYYAMAEQVAGGLVPDVLALKGPSAGNPRPSAGGGQGGGVALATRPPNAQFHAKSELDQYAAKSNAVVVRHTSDHEVIAIVEIISPGNKSGRRALRDFEEKFEQMIRSGVHVLVVDLFPPGALDPQGIQRLLISNALGETSFTLSTDKPLSIGASIAGPCPEAFVNAVAVGIALPDAALFLTRDQYVPVPLEETYQRAWEAVPAVWRDVLA